MLIVQTRPAGIREAAWHVMPAVEAVRALQVDPGSGLTGEEAAARLAELGPNRFAEGEPEPRRWAFARQYRDPMQTVLVAAGVGSLALGELATAMVVLSLTLLNAVLALQQEGKAAAAVAALQKMLIARARVRRDGRIQQIPAAVVVPGDVVLIEAGDVVPADGRLLQSVTLEVDESALTGKSLPVTKLVAAIDDADAPLGERTDLVYMNTAVTHGTAEFVVTATAMATEMGHIARMLQAAEDPETPFMRQLTRLTRQILFIAGAALAASMLLNLSRGQEVEIVLTAAVAFAIAAIPTALPVVLTTILAHAATALAGANAIVKRLRSTETLGSTSAINCDATGTLTLNQLTAVEMMVPGRRYRVSGRGYSTRGSIRHTGGQPEVPLEPLMVPMALVTDAVVTDGELTGDPTEGALVVLAEKGGLDVTATRESFPRVAELPFDATYKLMATFHRMTAEDGVEVVRCFVKGPPDQLIARATRVLGPDMRALPVSGALRERYLAGNARLAEQGLRVIATARRDFEPSRFDPAAALLPLVDGLTLLALVGIVDPPRPHAKVGIERAHAAGIQVRMITGEYAVTAEAIARDLGVRGRAVTGAELAGMTDEEALREIDGIGVIARVTPEDRVRLVHILQRRGHVVATTGDSVDAAPALRAADVGIAMGATGAEVSKEAAALIITDADFSTIVRAVESGRGLFGKLVEYIRFQTGVLAGMILTFLGAALLNVAGGLPLLPLQTLYVNFTTQLSQAVGLGYGRAAAGLMERRPRAVDEPIVPRRSYGWIAIVGAVHALATLAVMAIAEHEYSTATVRTMGLVTFSLLNLLFSFTVRHETRSVFSLDTFGDRAFVIASAASIAAIVASAQTSMFERILETTSLDLGQWLLCCGAALTIVAASEVRKLRLRAIHPETGDPT